MKTTVCRHKIFYGNKYFSNINGSSHNLQPPRGIRAPVSAPFSGSYVLGSRMVFDMCKINVGVSY